MVGLKRGDDLVYAGKAWRAEGASFQGGGNLGEVVLARRLSWVHQQMVAIKAGRFMAPPSAVPWGETEPLIVAATAKLDLNDRHALRRGAVVIAVKPRLPA